MDDCSGWFNGSFVSSWLITLEAHSADWSSVWMWMTFHRWMEGFEYEDEWLGIDNLTGFINFRLKMASSKSFIILRRCPDLDGKIEMRQALLVLPNRIHFFPSASRIQLTENWISMYFHRCCSACFVVCSLRVLSRSCELRKQKNFVGLIDCFSYANWFFMHACIFYCFSNVDRYKLNSDSES